MKNLNIKNKDCFQIICEKKSVKILEKDDWTIEWIELEWFASTKNKDRMNDIVQPKAFTTALDLYMKNPIVLLQHKHPIWVATEAQIKPKGLYVKVKITEDVNGVFSALKNWVLKAFSIWYRINEVEMKELEVDWDVRYEWIIKDLDLLEISLVSVPANPYALVKSMDNIIQKSFIKNSDKEVSEEKVEEDTKEEIKEEIAEEKTEKKVEEKTDEKKIWTEEFDKIYKEMEDMDKDKKVEEKKEVIEDEKVEEKNDEVEEKEDDTETKENQNTEWQEIIENQDSENSVETTDNKPVEEGKTLKEMSFTKIFDYIDSWINKNNETIVWFIKSKINILEKENKTLEDSLIDITWQFEKLVEYVGQLDQSIFKIQIKEWYTYEKADEVKKTAYSNLAEKLKTM